MPCSECEKLRAELAELKRYQMADLAMYAERDRLRAALERLAVLGEVGMKPDPQEWLTFHDKVAKVAREALRTAVETECCCGEPSTKGIVHRKDGPIKRLGVSEG